MDRRKETYIKFLITRSGYIFS